MPIPPPRAPTFPSFVDDVQEIDDADFVDDDIAVKTVVETQLAPSSTQPSTVQPMSQPPSALPHAPLRFAQSKSRLRALLLWSDPQLTALVLAACLLFFYLALARQLSVLSVVGLLCGCYLVVGLVVVHVNERTGGRLDAYVKRPPPGTPLFRPESVNRWAQTFLEEGNEIGDDIRDVLYCDRGEVTARWIAVSLGVYLAGLYFSVVTVLLVVTIAAFTLPLAYERNKKQVDDAAARATVAASKYIETGRRAAADKAVQLRDVAASRSAPYLEKAPPAAQNLLGKMGLMAPKKVQ